MTTGPEERRKRIRAAVSAYAYEVMNDSLISDHEYDKLCLEIDPSISTDNGELDAFFRDVFDPCTGVWVHYHPNIPGLKRFYKSLKAEKKKP